MADVVLTNSMGEEKDEDKKRRIRVPKIPKRVLRIALPALFFVVVIGGLLLYVKAKPEILGLSKNTDEVSQEEVEELVEEVGKLIELPDEVPTVATVTDIESINKEEQAFFANAQNGDKVLIYTNAKKAILYRPSENIIIEVGNVNLQADQPTPEPTAEPEQTEEPEESPTPTPSPSPAPTVTSTPTPTLLP